MKTIEVLPPTKAIRPISDSLFFPKHSLFYKPVYKKKTTITTMHNNWHPDEYLLSLVIARFYLVWVDVQVMKVGKFSLRLLGTLDNYCSWLLFLFQLYHNKTQALSGGTGASSIPIWQQDFMLRLHEGTLFLHSKFNVANVTSSFLGWRALCMWYHPTVYQVINQET